MSESDQTVSAGRLITEHFVHPDIANIRKYPASLLNEAAWIGEDRAVFIHVLLKMGMLPPAYPQIDLKKGEIWNDLYCMYGLRVADGQGVMALFKCKKLRLYLL